FGRPPFAGSVSGHSRLVATRGSLAAFSCNAGIALARRQCGCRIMNTATIVPARKEEPFHAGELRAHELAGGGPPGFAIRDAMPEQHRDFFSTLQYVM